MVEKEYIYQLLSTIINFKTILSLKTYPEKSYNFMVFQGRFSKIPYHLFIIILLFCQAIFIYVHWQHVT